MGKPTTPAVGRELTKRWPRGLAATRSETYPQKKSITAVRIVLSFVGRFRSVSKLFGVLAMIVALAGQVAIGAVVPRDDGAHASGAEFDWAPVDWAPVEWAPVDWAPVDWAQVDEATFICHAGLPTDPTRPAPAHHHIDCPICAFCQAQNHHGVILTPAPAAPLAPSALPMRARGIPPARAPPPAPLTAAYPRGPPDLA
jgi:hypothetical protein